MIKKSYLSILTLTALLWLGAGNAWGDELTVADGTATNAGVPICGNYADTKGMRSQVVYPASLLSELANGTISKVKFYSSTASKTFSSTFEVRLSEISASTLSGFNTDGGTVVYTGSLVLSGSEMEITFDTPFEYSGENNLLLDIEVTVNKSAWVNANFYGISQSGAGYSNKVNYGGAAVCNVLPKATFTYTPGVAPTCPKPKNLTKEAVSANSATFAWTAGGSEASWQWVCLPATSTLDWSGAETATSTSATVTGLSPEENYKFYVRAYCGATDQSGEITKAFKTPCNGYATADLPYEKNFNDLTSGSYPDCWTKVAFVSGTTSYPTIYNSNGESGSKSMRFYGGVTGTSEQIAILPPFEEETGNLLLSFWYKNSSTSYGQGVIGYITDPEDASTFHQLGNPLTKNTSGVEVNKFAMTGAPANSLIAIKFTGGSYSSNFYLDNIKVSLPSSCTDPSDVNAVAASATSATVSWTENGSATTWNLQYSTDNFATSTSVSGISENPYTLEGLTANTTYKVRVQADCGGEQSDWIASAAFPTPCEAVNGIGWSENFEDATAGSGKMPDCWQKITNNNSYPQVSSSPYYQKEGSSKCLYFYGGVTGSSEQIAILPPFTEATNTLYVTLDYSQGYEYYSSVYDYSGDDYGQLSIGYVINSTFTPQESLSRVSAYATASVALTNAPVGSRVAIRYSGGSSSGELFVDNITISTIPSCIAPTGVSGVATAYNQASISWTANNNESAWKLQYSSDNGATWSAEIDANTNPFTLTGLSANTDYIVQVKALCGGEDVSSWSMASAAIPTPCAPVDASDYSETMENATAGVGHLPDCWQYREKYGSGIPYVYNGSYYAYAGSQSLYFQGGVDESSEQSVLLPEMDQPLNNLTLEFYYKDAESTWYTYAKFTVGYIAADGTTFVPIETLEYADGYTKYTKDLSALPADAKSLAIRFAGGEYTAYGYIDNVRVYPTPTCAAPTGVIVSNETATTADVAWTENNGATAWNLQISNDGTNWTNVNGVITNPYQLTGLTPNHTTYYVRVNSVCGGTDASPWSEASAPFYTECGSVALPFSEDFNADLSCWTMVDCESSTGVNGNAFKFVYTYNPPQYLISPEIDTEGKPVTVAFDYYAYSSYYPETFKVGYSTTTKDISAFTWGAEQTSSNTDSPLTYSENLPAGVKYVAIAYTAYYSYYFFVDNFSVTEYVAPACPAVSAATLQESDVTAHTATVSWTAGGEETAWNLQYKSAGGEWSDVIAISTTPSYDFEGLAENTVYYVRVQANCGEDLSEWTGDEAFSFPTDCEPKAVSKATPWSYSFEDTEDGYMPSCWDREEPYANYGYPVVAEYSYYAHSGDKYLYFRTPGRSSVYEAYTEDAILPVFNTEIKNLKVSFVYFNNATTANYGQLAIGYVVGDAFTQVGELLAKVEDYTLVEREMPNDAPDGARIAIRCIGGNKGSSYTTYIYLDDVVVSLKPTCYTPTALAAAETSDGAQLSWTAGKDENEWSVRYSVKDADEWTVVDNEITATNYTLTGLSQNVTYEVQVKAVCGVGDESEWSASVEFTPACNAPSALAVTARTANSATFSWTSSESAWVLQYSADGENWESENVTTNPFTLNGLAAATTYQAKIQAACGSDFSNEVEFTTWCGLANANELPLNEDFSAGVKPACWEFISDTEYPVVTNEKIWFQGENEQIVMLPGYNINLNQLHVSFDFTANNASIELGYYSANGGAFQSLGAVTSGEDVDLSTKSAPAAAGYLAIRYYDATASWSTGSVDNVHVSRQIVLADGDDNSETLAANNGKTLDVQIGRTFFKGVGNNTICLPFSLPTLDGTPLEGGTLLAFKYGYVENGELLLRVYPAESMEAGVPYLISWEDGDNIVDPVFKSVTVAAAQGKSVGENNDVQFVGIFAPEIFPQDDKTKLFMLTNDQIAWSGVEANVANSLKSFRAYFQTVEAVGSNSGSAPIRHGMPARIVKQENSATGFENVQFDAQTLKLIENGNVVIIRNGVKYNLQGQVISK